jgi:hypothetical protein
MSALGQSQTSDWRPLMSALPPRIVSLINPAAIYCLEDAPLRLYAGAATLA